MYDVSYKIMDSKGCINFNARKIWINPQFNEDAITYVHELYHHHFDREVGEYAPEETIELLAEMFYAKNPLLCQKVVKGKIQESHSQIEMDLDGGYD